MNCIIEGNTDNIYFHFEKMFFNKYSISSLGQNSIIVDVNEEDLSEFINLVKEFSFVSRIFFKDEKGYPKIITGPSFISNEELMKENKAGKIPLGLWPEEVKKHCDKN